MSEHPMSDLPDREALWEGDLGTLRDLSRRALLEVLKGPYLSGRRRPQLWDALIADERMIRSSLHNLFLDLVIDRQDEFAFTRKVRTPEIDAPSALRAESLTLIDSIMLLTLRQLLLAAVGEPRVIIGKDELFERLLVYRTGDAQTYQRSLNAAWGRMHNRYRVIHTVDEERAEISPVVKFIVDHDLATALQEEYGRLAESGQAASADPTPDEGGDRADS